jgi:hypothetical protein
MMQYAFLTLVKINTFKFSAGPLPMSLTQKCQWLVRSSLRMCIKKDQQQQIWLEVIYLWLSFGQPQIFSQIIQGFSLNPTIPSEVVKV